MDGFRSAGRKPRNSGARQRSYHLGRCRRRPSYFDRRPHRGWPARYDYCRSRDPRRRSSGLARSSSSVYSVRLGPLGSWAVPLPRSPADNRAAYPEWGAILTGAAEDALLPSAAALFSLPYITAQSAITTGPCEPDPNPMPCGSTSWHGPYLVTKIRPSIWTLALSRVVAKTHCARPVNGCRVERALQIIVIVFGEKRAASATAATWWLQQEPDRRASKMRPALAVSFAGWY